MKNVPLPPASIGFIGLGQMGYPMARNLARAGYRILAWDANPAAVERFNKEVGCDVPASLSALGQVCEAVITMLPDGHIVREVLLGKNGDGSGDCVAAGLGENALVIDMSSSSPLGTRELGEVLEKRGIDFIDAPVSGGVKRALDGSLAIMAGGPADAIARAKPILDALGKQIFETGPLGSGHAMKALNNYVSAAGLIAAVEGVLAGNRFGLQADTIVKVLNASTGRNNSTENKFAQFILSRSFAGGFGMGLMVKDLRTALEVAQASGTPAPFAELCVELWSKAEKELGPQVDHTAVAQYWEGLAGSTLR